MKLQYNGQQPYYIYAIINLHYNPLYKKIRLQVLILQCQYMKQLLCRQTNGEINKQTHHVHPHPAFPPLLDLQLLAQQLDSGYHWKEALVTGGKEGREGRIHARTHARTHTHAHTHTSCYTGTVGPLVTHEVSLTHAVRIT